MEVRIFLFGIFVLILRNIKMQFSQIFRNLPMQLVSDEFENHAGILNILQIVTFTNNLQYFLKFNIFFGIPSFFIFII